MPIANTQLTGFFSPTNTYFTFTVPSGGQTISLYASNDLTTLVGTVTAGNSASYYFEGGQFFINSAAPTSFTYTGTNQTIQNFGLTNTVTYASTTATISGNAALAYNQYLTGTPGGAATLTAPNVQGYTYLIDNQSGQAVTVKVSGGTGISVASTKRAILLCNGTDYVRVTADA
jgi:hypothetical protein